MTIKKINLSGDYGERDPPVPIPNTAVKPLSADGTWTAGSWESRSLTDLIMKSPTRKRGTLLLSGATTYYNSSPAVQVPSAACGGDVSDSELVHDQAALTERSYYIKYLFQ